MEPISRTGGRWAPASSRSRAAPIRLPRRAGHVIHALSGSAVRRPSRGEFARSSTPAPLRPPSNPDLTAAPEHAVSCSRRTVSAAHLLCRRPVELQSFCPARSRSPLRTARDASALLHARARRGSPSPSRPDAACAAELLRGSPSTAVFFPFPSLPFPPSARRPLQAHHAPHTT